jgi:hypothetical protein
MTFKDQNWEERVEILGDPSEKAFQEYAGRRQLSVVKYGLDRPPVDLRRTPAFVRYTPDFLTDEGLIEVQGCGKDQLFKIKHAKLRALMQWNRQSTIRMWLWNQPMDDWRLVPVGRIATMCRDGRRAAFRTDGMFDGDVPYAAIPWVDLI